MFPCHIHAPQTQIWKANDWWGEMIGSEENWEGASDQSITVIRLLSKVMKSRVNKETEFKQLMHGLEVYYKSLCLLSSIVQLLKSKKLK